MTDMETSITDRPRRKRLRRRLVTITVVGVVLAAIFYGGGGWFFSSLLFNDALSGEQRRADLVDIDYNATVIEVGEVTVTLELPDDPPNELTTGELWGLRWEGGYGQVGAITAQDSTRVTRRFTQLLGPPLTAGTKTNLTSWTFPEDPKTGLGVEFEDVTYTGELGEYPAWFIPGDRDTWVIIVHGNSMSRLDGLRMLSITAAAGYPSLVITYRNDPGAPDDPSGQLQYGATEWKDVEAAVRYALDHGAPDVVLAAYSMGGGAVASFVYESPLADRVAGLVLDSPMLDFGTTVDYGASQEDLPVLPFKVPKSLANAAKLIASLRFGIDWGAVDFLERSSELTVGTLVIHGTDDLTVSIDTSRRLAEDRPDLVELVEMPGAEHVQSWNIDRATYERSVVEFLESVAG